MINQISICVAAVLLLSGCGDSSSGNNSGGGDVPSPKIIKMRISEPYNVYPGDQLVKTEEATYVSIAHIDGQDYSTVVLVEGSANIIPKQ